MPGSLAFASAKSRVEAVSMASISRVRNSAFGRPGGIGIEELDHDGARPALEASPWPERARIERDRHARYAQRVVEQHDPGLIVGRRAGRSPRAFREDDDLTSVGDALPSPRAACGEARSAPCRDRPGSSRICARTSRGTGSRTARVSSAMPDRGSSGMRAKVSHAD